MAGGIFICCTPVYCVSDPSLLFYTRVCTTNIAWKMTSATNTEERKNGCRRIPLESVDLIDHLVQEHRYLVHRRRAVIPLKVVLRNDGRIIINLQVDVDVIRRRMFRKTALTKTNLRLAGTVSRSNRTSTSISTP